MAFTYDPDATEPTAITMIRVRIRDIYADDPIFQDSELNIFLLLEARNIKKAAAMALETIAAEEALIQKVIKLQSLSTDGAKLAAELRENAKLLRQQAAADADAIGANDTGFTVVEWPVDVFSARNIEINKALRND